MKNRLCFFSVLLALLAGAFAVSAQNAVFTYQGRVLDNGTNFTGNGQFEFALVTSTNANQTATATVGTPSGGFITVITVTSGGSGYANAPVVTIFGGGGSNAVATAMVSGGSVTAININPGGNGAGYTNTPTVTIAPPPAALTYTTYWSNDGTSSAGSEPNASVGVNVVNGLFTVVLGDMTVPNMSAINASLFSQPDLQLQMWFNDGTSGFAGLYPPSNITPTPYATFANTASNLLGTVPAAQLSGTVANATLPVNPSFTGTVTATNFSGSGANLTSLNASSLTNGTVPLTQLSGITSNQLDVVTWQLATNLNGGNAAQASNLIAGVTITGVTISNSTFAGNGALLINLNGAQLVSIGNTNVGSGGNFFAGTAGNSTMVGYNNTGLGVHALAANTNGTDNSAVGLNTLYQNSGGNNNTASGAYALQANTTGNNNTANGEQALYANTNGANNTATGLNALYQNAGGSANSAHGAYALHANIGASGNTAVGYYALYANINGSNNIALGYQAGQTILLNSNIDIGSPGLPSDANVIRIGNGQGLTYIAGIAGTTAASGVAVYVTPSGQLGVLSSSARFKHDIQPMNDASDVLLALHPVTFKYKPELDPQGIPQFGLVAEEVNKIDPDLVAHDSQGRIYTVRYEAINAMLLNEFLKQHQKVEEQNRKIETLEAKAAQVDALENRLNELQATVKQLAAQK